MAGDINKKMKTVKEIGKDKIKELNYMKLKIKRKVNIKMEEVKVD